MTGADARGHDAARSAPAGRRLRLVWIMSALIAALLGLGTALYLDRSPDTGKALLESSAAPVTTTEGGLRFGMLAAPRPLPTIRFVDDSGRSMTIKDFNGKVILLNIWATWCTPCRKEMPTLDRLQARLGGADFEVVALSIDGGEQALAMVKDFYWKIDIGHLRIYVDPEGDAAFRLGAIGIPTTLLLDRHGMELGRMSGIAEWDSLEAVAFIERQLARAGRRSSTTQSGQAAGVEQ